MSTLHLYPPNLADIEILNFYTLASRSKTFAEDLARMLKFTLTNAEADCDKAHRDNDSDTWNDQRQLAKAEDALDIAHAKFDHIAHKLAWEAERQYGIKFVRTAEIVARTKALLLRIDWPNIRSVKWRKK